MTLVLPWDPFGRGTTPFLPIEPIAPGGGPIEIDPTGISGCVNVFGQEICANLPLPGSPGAPSPEIPPTGGTPFAPSIDCPEGSFWSVTLQRCVDPSAAFPGGDPFIFPGSPNGNGACPAGGVPKVQTTRMVTPILWLTQFRCKPGTGYRLNKSAFWRMDPARGQVVRIGEGQAWVRGRRKNPSNMRATDNAASRVLIAKNAMQSLGRITVKSKADFKAQRQRRKK